MISDYPVAAISVNQFA